MEYNSAQSRLERIAKEYACMDWTFRLLRLDDGIWYIDTMECDGCMSQGATITQAFANIREALAQWILVALEDGEQIPLPQQAVGWRKIQ